MDNEKTSGLWRKRGIKGCKYLVQRRDGTVPEWPSFVIGAKDPAAPTALRAYADAAERLGFDARYVADVRELADDFEEYRKAHGNGDPDAVPHRKDDPCTVAKMTNRYPWRVTITGADDNTNPDDLLELSKRFPFVEWGILHSTNRFGTPRYPSGPWVNRLLSHPGEAKFSLHACGDFSRNIMNGLNLDYVPIFSRIQINGFKLEKISNLKPWGGEYILQCGDMETVQGVADFAAQHPDFLFSVLFDASGGRGLMPSSWPRPLPGVRMGYAGGIGPSNVRDVLRDIGPVEPTWIDMESGVRTDDRLDLGKVEAVLRQVAEFSVQASLP